MSDVKDASPFMSTLLNTLCSDVLLEILSYLTLGDILSLQTVSKAFRDVASLDLVYQHLCDQRWNFFSGHAGVTLRDLFDGSWLSVLKKLASLRIVDELVATDGHYTGFDSWWRIPRVFLDEEPISIGFDDDDGTAPPDPDRDRHIVQYAVYSRNNYYVPAHVWMKNEFVYVPEDPKKNKHGFAVRWRNSWLMGQSFGILGSTNDDESISVLLKKHPGHSVFFPDSTRMSFAFHEDCTTCFSYWGFDMLRGTKIRDALVAEREDFRPEYCEPQFMKKILEKMETTGNLITLACSFDLHEKTVSFIVEGVDLGVAFHDVDAKSVVPVIYLFSDDYYELMCCY